MIKYLLIKFPLFNSKTDFEIMYNIITTVIIFYLISKFIVPLFPIRNDWWGILIFIGYMCFFVILLLLLMVLDDYIFVKNFKMNLNEEEFKIYGISHNDNTLWEIFSDFLKERF